MHYIICIQYMSNINFIVSAPLYRASEPFRQYVTRVMEMYVDDYEAFMEAYGDTLSKKFDLLEIYLEEESLPPFDEAFVQLFSNEGLIVGMNRSVTVFNHDSVSFLYSKYAFT